jgi:GTP cyclohydrolase II
MSGMLTRLNQEQKSIKLTNILKSQNLQKNTQKNLKGSHQKDQKETWWT